MYLFSTQHSRPGLITSQKGCLVIQFLGSAVLTAQNCPPPPPPKSGEISHFWQFKTRLFSEKPQDFPFLRFSKVFSQHPMLSSSELLIP